MANATNTTDTVVDNDDDTLIAGISAYLPMFCVTLVLYAVLHSLFRRYFYTNIRRGTGPSIPSRGSLCGWLFCVPMLRGEGQVAAATGGSFDVEKVLLRGAVVALLVALYVRRRPHAVL